MQYNFIIAHKPFDKKPFTYMANKEFISDNATEGTTNVTNMPDSRIYGELTFWLYIYNKLKENDDWAALHHYRRKFECVHQQICVAKPMAFNCSLYDQLSAYHSPRVADAMEKAIGNPVLRQTNLFFPYNIFNVPKEVLGHWIQFCSQIVDNTLGILNLRDKTFEEIKEFVSNDSTFTGPNPQNPSKNLDPIYQTRIGAYILERANSLFWLTQFPGNFIPCEISLLEQGQKI